MKLYLTLTPESAALLVRDLEARERSAGQSPLRQAVLADLRGLVELSEPPHLPGCDAIPGAARHVPWIKPMWMRRPFDFMLPPMTGEGI